LALKEHILAVDVLISTSSQAYGPAVARDSMEGFRSGTGSRGHHAPGPREAA